MFIVPLFLTSELCKEKKVIIIYNLPFINYTPYNPYIPAYYMHPQSQTFYYPTNIEQRITYPAADPTLFMKSASQSQDLLNDAQKVSNQLSHSHNLSKNIIEAAQQSKTEEVKRLLNTLALKNRYDVYYNPDGIIITLKPKEPINGCCVVTLSLKWQNF